jgi:hypothetical protein
MVVRVSVTAVHVYKEYFGRTIDVICAPGCYSASLVAVPLVYKLQNPVTLKCLTL